MRNSINFFLYALLIIAISITSCDQEDSLLNQEDNIIQFSSTEKIFAENAGSQTIAISFLKPTNIAGTISVAIESNTTGSYVTIPASVNGLISLPIARGERTATIQLIPVDNNVVNESTIVSIKFKTTSSGFIIGEKNEFKAIITDDELPEPPLYSEANFISQNAILSETNETGLELQIHFSKPIAQEGSIMISYQSEKATEQHFRTEPALENGKITLLPTLNANTTSFKIFPINNTIITGELEIKFQIDNTSGSITKGENVLELVKILDDELIGKPRGYQTAGGIWGMKETIEYNERGDVYKVLIEKSTPAYSAYTETYYYDAQNRIERINQYENIDIVYTWQNNEIVKSEEVKNGVVSNYTIYTYDDYGNVSGSAIYYRQSNGDYSLGFTILYLYFLDGNLYKKMMYNPQNGEDVLIKTETFEHYAEGENPFPMVKILPNKKTQKKLPLSYQVDQSGSSQSYTLFYEFRTDGLVGKRTVRGGDVSETAIYFYY